MISAPTENGKKVLTMAEYIERETAIEWFMPYAHAGESIDADVVISDIKGMKAADVAPVRHARWEVVVGSDGKEHMVCTGCRKQQDLTGVFSYCPNCGCRMDGGDDE